MTLVDFDYAIVRWVPSVCRGEFRNVGVVLHAPTAQFLRAVCAQPPDLPPRVARYLQSFQNIAVGAEHSGPLGRLSRSERFHWLTAPRSDSIQVSPCHPGRASTDELDATLERIFQHVVSHGDPHD